MGMANTFIAQMLFLESNDENYVVFEQSRVDVV
jgi:hypothetical protein